MANKSEKNFDAMVKESKDMPKYVEIKELITYEEIIKRLPHGKIITVGELRGYFAEMNNALG